MNNAFVRINAETQGSAIYLSQRIESLEDIQRLIYSLGGEIIIVEYEFLGEKLYALTFMKFALDYKISLNFTYQIKSQDHYNKLLAGFNGKKATVWPEATILTLIDDLYLIAPDEKN